MLAARQWVLEQTDPMLVTIRHAVQFTYFLPILWVKYSLFVIARIFNNICICPELTL